MEENKTTNSYMVKAGEVEGVLSEGRKELKEATDYMNQIKRNIAEWQKDTNSFLEEVTTTYKSKVEEIESNPNQTTALSRVRALWHTLPTLIRGEDPTKKRFGVLLNKLVDDADRVYKGLDTKLDEYERHFDEVDKLTENLLKDAKTCRAGIERYDSGKKGLEAKLGELRAAMKGKEGREEKDEEYLRVRKEVLDTTRQLEETRKLRTSAINYYQQALNILDALDSFREENQIMLSEGRNIYETLDTNIKSLRPLFEQISSSADLVEFQKKALDTYDMLKRTFNPAMIAITAVAKGVSKVASERMGEKFIEAGTMEAVRALTDGHKKELAERSEQEDKIVEEILGSKNPSDKEIILEKGEDGVFRPAEKTQEPSNN